MCQTTQRETWIKRLTSYSSKEPLFVYNSKLVHIAPGHLVLADVHLTRCKIECNWEISQNLLDFLRAQIEVGKVNMTVRT